MRIDVIKQGGYGTGGLSTGGGTLSGPLLLSRNPQTQLEAATKQYVDDGLNSLNAGNFSQGTLAIARLPALSGDVSSDAGSNNIFLSNTGVVAGSYAKVTVNTKGRVTGGTTLGETDIPGLDFSKITIGKPTTLAGYGIGDGLSLAGGSMTGALTLHADPTSDTHLVTKQYMDGIIGSLSGAKIGDVLRKPYSETPNGFLKCNGAEVSKTTYSNLYAIIGDQYSSNTIAGSGQPWRQQYQINDQQSVNWGSWTTLSNFGSNTGYSTSVVTKNRVYLLGGWTGSNYSSTVYTAPINADGTLGSWSTGTSLPYAVGNNGCVVTKNRIYLMGGSNDSVHLASVLTAPINADGTIGSWTTTTSMPGILANSVSFITKNRVYLCGGDNNSYVSLVYTAPINSDGTLGAWTTGTSLPGPLGRSCLAVTKNRVYLLGGATSGGTVSTVYTAPINSDGTIGTWTTGPSLPGVIQLSTSLVTKHRIYMFGGFNGSDLDTNYTAPINADGTIGAWTTGTPIVNAKRGTSVIATKNYIYTMGGVGSNAVHSVSITGGLNDYSPYYTEDTTNYMTPGSGKPWQQQYQLNETQNGDITGWATGTAFPIVNNWGTPIVTKNRVYFVVGSLGSVYTAPINSDGTLGTWTTGTALPGGLGLTQAVITKNRIYLLGGNNGSAAVSTTYTAPINSDGTLGTWVAGTLLPVAVYTSQAIVIKNRVYLLGGYNGSVPLASVYVATIGTDGIISAWSTGNNLPSPLQTSQAIVTKNRVYLIGGHNGTTDISTVYTASITSDGTLAAWSTSTSLPTPVGRSQVFATKNRVYLFGGITANSTEISTVQTAPINADGTLGTWTTGTALPVALGRSSFFATKNKVYLIGGTVATVAVSTVYTATINEGLNDYSPWYDGTVLPIEPTNPTTVFKIPDFSPTDVNGIYHYIKF